MRVTERERERESQEEEQENCDGLRHILDFERHQRDGGQERGAGGVWNGGGHRDF